LKDEWYHFKDLFRKKHFRSGEECIEMFLNHFRWQYKEYLGEFFLLCEEKGFYRSTCEVQDAIDKHILKYDLKRAIRKQRRAKLKKSQRQKNQEAGRDFENIIVTIFERMGYQVLTTGLSRDFGADLILECHGIRTAVQTKKQKKKVGVSAIQEVVAAKSYYRCHKAMVVITSHFTKPAKKLAYSNSVDLWDWDKLMEEIDKLP
jgi:restriction system protein